MTVCVAALSGSMVVGASDRMLTSADIQFEPPRAKIETLTTSIVVMASGDSTVHAESLIDVRRDVRERIRTEPTNWWKIRDVASLYATCYRRVRLHRQEVAILSPLGLDANTFMTRNRELAPKIVSDLTNGMADFRKQVSVILSGVDEDGPHIYVVHDGTPHCMDSVGFAAIGAGRRHAESQLMFARHTQMKEFPETLLLTCSAKKRAEVAPGVGRGTDMFVIGPQLGSYISVGQELIGKLESEHGKASRTAEQAEKRAAQRMKEYFDKLLEASRKDEKQAAPAAEEKPPASDT